MLEPAGDVRHGAHRQGSPDRLALQRLERGAALPRPLPPARPRRRLRRRRRRQPPGLGRRVGGRPRPADRRDDRARRRAAGLGASRGRPRRRHDRRPAGRPPRGADPRRPVRRAAHGRPAAVLHLHRGHAGRRRARPAEDRGRGARGRSRIRARPAQDRRRARQSRRDDREAARDRAPPRARRDRFRLVALGPRARDQLRPRVRAGAADRDAARARAGPARAGRYRGLARVHGDALRPDPARPLPGRAGDDRAEDLGRAEDAADLRPRALARRRGSSCGGVRGAGRTGRRLDRRRRPRAALALPRPDRGRPDGQLRALQFLQVRRRDGREEPALVPEHRACRPARWGGRARRRRRADAVRWDRLVQLGRTDVEQRRRDRPRCLRSLRSSRPRRLGLQPAALAAALT